MFLNHFNIKNQSMKNRILLSLIVALFSSMSVIAQDTFSIVAVDPETGEVGSAGASCVDLIPFPGFADDFLGELIPGVGAINTQAWYNQTNQINARNRMNNGDTPSEIIDWLINNDDSNQPDLRQYGIAAIVDGSSEAAGHTGTSTDDYKNHIIGPNYAIQGNILLGQEILDSIESKFLKANGDLACKLMAALQGANVVGADTRCAPNGTSSLFAFVKVAQPGDTFGNPSFVQSLRTADGEGIEPIDSLQTLFDAVHSCNILDTKDINDKKSLISIYPNPVEKRFVIENKNSERFKLEILNATGSIVYKATILKTLEIDASAFSNGIYMIRFSNDNEVFTSKLIKN